MTKPPTTQGVIAALRKASLYSGSTYLTIYKWQQGVAITIAPGYDFETRASKPRTQHAANIKACLEAKGWQVRTDSKPEDTRISLFVWKEAPHGLA